MKRNWNVVREILEQIEQNTLTAYLKQDKYFDVVDDRNDFLGHIEILIDAGIIKHCHLKRNDKGEFDSWDFRGIYITMSGHDLLDALRDKTVWTQIKKKAVKAGVSISWEFIKIAIPLVIKELVLNE